MLHLLHLQLCHHVHLILLHAGLLHVWLILIHWLHWLDRLHWLHWLLGGCLAHCIFRQGLLRPIDKHRWNDANPLGLAWQDRSVGRLGVAAHSVAVCGRCDMVDVASAEYG